MKTTASTSTSKIQQLRREAAADAAKEITELKKRAKADGITETKAAKLRAIAERESEPTAMRPTVTSRKEKRTFIMPDVTPKAPKVKKEKKVGPRRTSEADLIRKYKHVIPGTLAFNPDAHKQECRAKLACGHIETVYTSDLFQVKRCKACRKAVVKEKVKMLRETKGVKGKIAKAAKKAAAGKAVVFGK